MARPSLSREIVAGATGGLGASGTRLTVWDAADVPGIDEVSGDDWPAPAGIATHSAAVNRLGTHHNARGRQDADKEDKRVEYCTVTKGQGSKVPLTFDP